MSMTRRWRFFPLVALAAAFLLVTGLMIGFGNSTRAQEEEEASHPAHIHDGTCGDGLGAVVYPLANVGAGLMMGTPQPESMVGAADAIPADTSITVVQAAFADITGGVYAVNVHESDENIGNYIACGNVGGEAYGPDLAFGLAELNDSGYSGIAWLHDNGDGTTTVAVFLVHSMEGGEATPEESPEEGAAAPSGEEVAVSIADFAYDPNPLDITVGTTVTWTNEDSAPHTATQDGGGFNSDRLDQGASFSFTFDTPGTYAYHCEFHANMTATINVT
jgi:plastocyanin